MLILPYCLLTGALACHNRNVLHSGIMKHCIKAVQSKIQGICVGMRRKEIRRSEMIFLAPYANKSLAERYVIIDDSEKVQFIMIDGNVCSSKLYISIERIFSQIFHFYK